MKKTKLMIQGFGLSKLGGGSNYSGSCLGTSVIKNILMLTLSLVLTQSLKAQDKIAITLPEALDTGIKNYPSIKAKTNYVDAAHALIVNARNEYLPNVIGSVQQSYGTVNGQYGPAAPI